MADREELIERLDRAYDIVSDIKGDFTDPRAQCREAMDEIRAVQAALRAQPAGVKGDAEAARDALRELASVKMDLSLEDWCRISNTILSALEPVALSKQEAETEAWSRLRRVSDIAHNAATADRLPSSTARQVLADIVTLSECYGASPVLAEPSGWQPTHRHVKKGGEYMLLGIGKMQSAEWCDPHGQTPTVDMREVAIYVGADGQRWVRPREEFEDGRFAVNTHSPEK